MSIIRIKKRETPYVQIDKRPLSDDRLSWRAKGLWCYLLSKPDNWEVRSEDVLKHGTEGRDAVRAAMAELKQFGYAELLFDRNKETGRTSGNYWHVYEEPVGLKNHQPDFPSDGKTPPSNNKSERKNKGRESIRFTPPTIEEVKEHGAKIGLTLDESEKFFYYQETKGWRVGREQMKKWTSAMQTWKKNAETFAKSKSPDAGKPKAVEEPQWKKELRDVVKDWQAGKGSSEWLLRELKILAEVADEPLLSVLTGMVGEEAARTIMGIK